MIDKRRCDLAQHWWGRVDNVVQGPDAYHPSALDSVFGPYRIALRKLPERKLLNFREAVAAHGKYKIVKCEGDADFYWDPGRTYPQAMKLNAVPFSWLIDRTDFYAEEPT